MIRMFRKNKLFAVMLILALSAFMIAGCGGADQAQAPADQAKDLEGELVVYHAGSLTVPFEAVEKEFEALHPNVDIQRTAGGSRTIARKVTELGDKVDVLASADYTVIDTLVMPDFADWNALFARNSMVIMYTDKSKYADEITKKNWTEVLLRDGVNYGHSEPDADPCGYRTVLTWQLAEKKYEQEGLFQDLMDHCPAKNVRPKSVELISMLETGAMDYAFEYESVARQHQLMNSEFKYVELPKKINLSSIEEADFYKDATIELAGKEPGETVTKKGQPIVYSLTMPKTGENNELAVEFLKFLFDREGGLKVLEDNGQPVLETIEVNGAENLPEGLKGIVE